MELRPILSTLRRHKIAASLIVLEIALSCAIICNALFLVSGRITRIDMPSGVAEAELSDVIITGIGTDTNAMSMTRDDLAALRAIPGVEAAAVTNQVPFGNSSWNSSLTLTPDQKGQTANATVYFDSGGLLETLGTRLVAGRGFQPDEMAEYDQSGRKEPEPHSAIITRALAEKLYPGGSAIGKTFYFGNDKPLTVVGVLDRLVRPSLFGGDETADYSVVLPIDAPYTVGGHYLIRGQAGQNDRIMAAAEKALQKNGPNRIILEKRSFATIREKFFRQDRSMVWLLSGVCIALLVVTALGIVGLASFWVQQRTKQIGIRRALGATRSQVLRYFQTENFVLATVGIVVGMVLAYGLNQVLMGKYELPRLPAIYLPVGAVALWLLGQLSVLGPARRAAAVPPAVATRSV